VNLIERPTAGSIRVSGQELTHLSRRRTWRCRCGSSMPHRRTPVPGCASS
jgi:ABC-type methionine transport system ATPase subunit